MKLSLAIAVTLTATAISQPNNQFTHVDLSIQRGKPQNLASGFIYGIPDTLNQIPGHYYTDMGFRYGRAGGAQEGAPNRGWIWGMTDYQGRLKSTLTNYRTCREYGADFIILPHDIWGTDQSNSSTVWPGDGGDWADYDRFIAQLMADLKANDALEGLVWDIWNEPDLEIFWARGQQQWIDLYVRTHRMLRADPDFASVLISGPTLSAAPFESNSWWTNWLQQIQGNGTVPDQYVYHLEAGPESLKDDLEFAVPSLNSLLANYGLPKRQININEYATLAEQVPSGAAWWISRLERYDALGLRGNWQSKTTLHDLLANLLTKGEDPFNYSATDYMPAPEYTVYQYYHTNMTGVRVKTTGSADLHLDVYATAEPNGRVRILAGSRGLGASGTSSTWSIVVENMRSVGLPAQGDVEVHTWNFPGSNMYEAYWAPVDLGVASYSYEDDTLAFPVKQTTNYTAYAFEFSCGRFSVRA